MKNIVNIIVLQIMFSLLLFGVDIKLIDPKEAIRMIGNKKVIFISGDSAKEYTKQHILNSIEMYAYDLHYLDTECRPLSTCPNKAQDYIKNKGITDDQLIIAYDNLHGYNALGVYSFFISLGHLNINVLNGGISTIKALDPNQKVFDKLRKEQMEIDKELLIVTEAKDTEKVLRLKDDLASLQATINILRPKLLIQGIK